MVDGAPMFEALAIMQWLGDRFGVDKGLWPAADSQDRLAALSWSTWAYVSFAGTVRIWNMANSEAVRSEALASFADKELRGHLGVLDGWLKARTYVLGDDFSLADLIVGSSILWARVCKAPVDEYPHVKAWAEAVAARPSIRKAWT